MFLPIWNVFQFFVCSPSTMIYYSFVTAHRSTAIIGMKNPHVYSQFFQGMLQILVATGFHSCFHGPVRLQGGPYGMGNIFPLIIWVMVLTLYWNILLQSKEEELLQNNEKFLPIEPPYCVISSKPSNSIKIYFNHIRS